MEDPSTEVRSEFIQIVDGLVVRLHDTTPGTTSDRGRDPGRVANLGHRISDTLPSDLAEQLEELVDELLTISHRVWPDRPGIESRVTPDPELQDRLERLGRRWSRLKPNLMPD